MTKKIKFFLGLGMLFFSPLQGVHAVEPQGVPPLVFSKREIVVDKIHLQVEIASTPQQHERGLMYRTALDEGKGMLFIFANEQTLNFWMKNTFIPLAIGYFDRQKKLIDIQEMAATSSEMVTNPPTYPSSKPAQYALEVPKGWFQQHKIKVGAVLRILDL